MRRGQRASGVRREKDTLKVEKKNEKRTETDGRERCLREGEGESRRD